MAEPARIAGFREECALLAPLESFDPEAFRGDAKVSQEICNFVLLLALIYNDCKDAIYAHVALDSVKPETPYQRNRIWGAVSGVQMHTLRVVTGILHELFKVIRENQDLLKDAFFVELVRSLRPETREAWEELVSVAQGATPKDRLGRQLLMIRNKASFHYDGKAIFTGYAWHFLAEKAKDDRAFVSRGGSMRTTRFYFADAAGGGYYRSVAGSEEAESLKASLEDIVDRVNHGLMLLIGAFILQRRYSFRQEAER